MIGTGMLANRPTRFERDVLTYYGQHRDLESGERPVGVRSDRTWVDAMKLRAEGWEAHQRAGLPTYFEALDGLKADVDKRWKAALAWAGDRHEHETVELSVVGDVDRDMVETAIGALMQRPRARAARIEVSSRGGHYASALLLVHALELFKKNGGVVQAHARYRCESAAFSIFMTARDRSAAPRAKFWLHKVYVPGAPARGRAENMWADVQEERIAAEAGVDAEWLHELRDSEQDFGRDIAIEAGIVNWEGRLPSVPKRKPVTPATPAPAAEVTAPPRVQARTGTHPTDDPWVNREIENWCLIPLPPTRAA